MTLVALTPAVPGASTPFSEALRQLSPARARLAQAIAAHDAGREALAAAQQPLDRLAGAIRASEEAARELAAFREKDEGILADWLSEGAEAPRPLPGEETLGAERRAAERLEEGEAARKALPQAQAAFERSADRARALRNDRDAALYAAAIEAAREFAPKAEAALAEYLTCEATLLSLAEELQRRANAAGGSPEAGNAAAQIRDLVTTIKRLAGVPLDRESGPRLLEGLTTDPTESL